MHRGKILGYHWLSGQHDSMSGVDMLVYQEQNMMSVLDILHGEGNLVPMHCIKTSIIEEKD